MVYGQNTLSDLMVRKWFQVSRKDVKTITMENEVGADLTEQQTMPVPFFFDSVKRWVCWRLMSCRHSGWDLSIPCIKIEINAVDTHDIANKDESQTSNNSSKNHVHSVLGHGFLLVDFIPRDQTINGAAYCEMLRILRCAIQIKSRDMVQQDIVLIHDSTRSHKVIMPQ